MTFPTVPFLRKTLALAGLLFFANHSFSQSYTTKKTATGKAKEAFGEGQKFSASGDYGKALVAYSRALKADSTFIDALIWMGGCERELKNGPEAEAAFERAARLAPDYEPRVYLNLAQLEGEQGKFLEMAEHADRFLSFEKTNPASRKEMQRLAQNGRFAAKALQNPVPFDPKPLPPAINTKDDEYLPAITADGERMIFCRRKSDENFFSSQKIDSVWQPAVFMDAINTPGNEGAQSLSVDGGQLFFTACGRREDGLGSCDLYFSENKNGAWTKPRNLGAPVNSPSWDSQPSLSADGRTLFFASDRTDGWGGKDIWLAKKDPSTGRWAQPQNIGGPINTQGNEQAPFIHPDGQTLYFMSDRLPGMGTGPLPTFDLFLSRKKPDGSWGEPENLGYPINTAGNEGAFYVSLDGRTAYFSAQNSPKGMGGDDIFSFELPQNLRPQPMTFVKGRVKDFDTGQPLVAKTDFLDLADRQPWASSVSAADGTFLTCLPVGKNLSLEVSKSGYLFHSENFNLTEAATAAQPFLLEIALQKLPVAAASSPEKPAAGKPIVLKNIFFETNSATLRPESEAELAVLKKLLEENPTLKIRINGHTDDVGGEAENQLLSENRARAVLDFLTKNGIAAGRLSSRGFGKTMPVAPNTTAEGRAANRRTEFEVVGN